MDTEDTKIEVSGYWILFLILAIAVFIWSYPSYFKKKRELHYTYLDDEFDSNYRMFGHGFDKPYIVGNAGRILQNMFWMQEDFKYSNPPKKDINQNSIGEYGNLKDLVYLAPNNEYLGITPLDNNQEIFSCLNGYYYRSYISNDPDLAEKHFVILAWPKKRGSDCYNTFLATDYKIYVWVSPGRSFSGKNAPKLTDVFFSKAWESPINLMEWREGEFW